MKKFKFNLEKLLTYKDQNLDSELMNLGVLYSQLHEAEKKLNLLQHERDECIRDCESAINGNSTVAICRLYTDYADFLTKQIKECEQKIGEILVQIDEQIDIVKELKVETKSLENIKESRYEVYKNKSLKKAELQIEEFVTTAEIIRKF
ncbi:MAG: flagellar FliJ family protein [Eubacteriales bacterium]|nr:flagellar FliJ family protein [Eubacteriales bacterium]